LERFIPRSKEFSFFKKIRKIYTIIWPRKAGKTYFLYQIIDNLLKSWVRKENTLYIYLENDEIFPVNLEDLNDILRTYFEIVWYNRKEKYYIFFDEIQVVENWQKFATKIYSEFKNVEFIVTWSSSKLLSSEISTWLRWKANKTELFPISFSEVLKFKNFETKKYYNFEEEIKLKTFRKIILSYMTNFINFSELAKKVWVDYNTVLNWVDYFNQVYFIF